MLRTLTVALLCACTGSPPPAPAEAEPFAALGLDTDGPERACVEARCADADELAACRATRCAPREATWSVAPTRVRYEDGVALVEAEVIHAPGGFGEGDAFSIQRAEPVYLGATLITSEAEEIDLAVNTLQPDPAKMVMQVSSEVGDDVDSLILGVWNEKVQPCDSDRMGCKAYGFVLDGSLATWPDGVYATGARQRIHGGPYTLRVIDAGGGPAVADVVEPVTAALADAVGVFGHEVANVEVRPGEGASGIVVRHKHPKDVEVARRVAEALSPGANVAHDADAPADIVVMHGGSSPVPACADKTDEAYLACVREADESAAGRRPLDGR